MGNRKFFAAYGALINQGKMIHLCPEVYMFGWGYIPKLEMEFRTVNKVKIFKVLNVPVVLYRITQEDEKELDSFF